MAATRRHDPLAGTEFTITRKADGELMETLTTDASGYAISDALLYGTYTITETKGIDSHKTRRAQST